MTGERFIPGMSGIIELEHMHRYTLALALSRGKRVLDVASGEGYGSHLLSSAAASVIGVDICKEAIEYARKRYCSPNLEFLIGSCNELPIEDNSIDFVVSFETIEHHDQHQQMLREIVRVLRHDGLLLISSPNKKSYSDIPGTHNKFHVRELYLDEFNSLLDEFFPNVVLYGQRALTCSVIAPLVPFDTAFKQLQACDRNDSACSLEPATYFLALAGMASSLPSLGVSIYENQSVNTHAKESQLVPAVYESKMFWRHHWQEKYDGYSEDKSSALLYPVDGQPHQIRLRFPEDLGEVTRIRLDILNTVGVVDIHAMQLVAPDERLIWQWQGDLQVFARRVQVALMANSIGKSNGFTVVSLGNDPWFELDLPGDVYRQITPGCILILTLTPYALLDRLPDILKQSLRFVEQPQSMGTESASVPFSETFYQPSALPSDPSSTASLLNLILARHDITIAEQGRQLREMRDELIRAEAQLNLLKDMLLNGRGIDRL